MTLCENLNIAYRLYLPLSFPYILNPGRRGRDRIVVGFTTICSISVYHH